MANEHLRRIGGRDCKLEREEIMDNEAQALDKAFEFIKQEIGCKGLVTDFNMTDPGKIKIAVIDNNGNLVHGDFVYTEPVEVPAQGVIVASQSGELFFSGGSLHDDGSLICSRKSPNYSYPDRIKPWHIMSKKACDAQLRLIGEASTDGEIRKTFMWCNDCTQHGIRSISACEGCVNTKPSKYRSKNAQTD